MLTHNTQILCVGASTWTVFLAWFQIVLASFGIIGLLATIAGVELPNVVMTIDYQELTTGMIFAILVMLVLQVALTVLLIYGNQKEKLGLLWTWQIYEGISLLLVISGALMRVSAGDESVSAHNIVLASISAFMIYVVHLRIQDIEGGSGGKTYKR